MGTALLVFGVDLLRPRRHEPARPGPRNIRAAVLAAAAIGVLGGLVAGTAAILQGAL